MKRRVVFSDQLGVDNSSNPGYSNNGNREYNNDNNGGVKNQVPNSRYPISTPRSHGSSTAMLLVPRPPPPRKVANRDKEEQDESDDEKEEEENAEEVIKKILKTANKPVQCQRRLLNPYQPDEHDRINIIEEVARKYTPRMPTASERSAFGGSTLLTTLVAPQQPIRELSKMSAFWKSVAYKPKEEKVTPPAGAEHRPLMKTRGWEDDSATGLFKSCQNSYQLKARPWSARKANGSNIDMKQYQNVEWWKKYSLAKSDDIQIPTNWGNTTQQHQSTFLDESDDEVFKGINRSLRRRPTSATTPRNAAKSAEERAAEARKRREQVWTNHENLLRNKNKKWEEHLKAVELQAAQAKTEAKKAFEATMLRTRDRRNENMMKRWLCAVVHANFANAFLRVRKPPRKPWVVLDVDSSYYLLQRTLMILWRARAGKLELAPGLKGAYSLALRWRLRSLTVNRNHSIDKVKRFLGDVGYAFRIKRLLKIYLDRVKFVQRRFRRNRKLRDLRLRTLVRSWINQEYFVFLAALSADVASRGRKPAVTDSQSTVGQPGDMIACWDIIALYTAAETRTDLKADEALHFFHNFMTRCSTPKPAIMSFIKEKFTPVWHSYLRSVVQWVHHVRNVRESKTTNQTVRSVLAELHMDAKTMSKLMSADLYAQTFAPEEMLIPEFPKFPESQVGDDVIRSWVLEAHEFMDSMYDTNKTKKSESPGTAAQKQPWHPRVPISVGLHILMEELHETAVKKAEIAASRPAGQNADGFRSNIDENDPLVQAVRHMGRRITKRPVRHHF